MEWIDTTVGEFCPFVYGKAIKKSDQISQGVPVFGSNGVYAFSEKPLVDSHGVIIGRKGSVGKIHLSEEAFWVSDTAYYTNKATLADTYFVYYLLSSLGLENMNTDAAVPGLNRSNAHRLEIKVPKYASAREQLIAPLMKLDNKIQLNHRINDTLEQIAQALFKSWFVDFEPVKAKIATLEVGGNDEDALLAAMEAVSGKTADQLSTLSAEHPERYAELRATAELFPSAMQDSELGEIPEGWEALPLSNMIKLIGGGTPKKSEPAYWNGEICWFSVKDAPQGGNIFVIDTEDKITKKGLQDSSTKLLPIGTTIITARGTVGKLALTGVVTAMNQSCYGVIGDDGAGPCLNYLRLNQAVVTLKRNTHGAVFDTITRTTFETVVQPQAPLALRQRFEEMVTSSFEAIKNNLHQTKTLSELRDTLLPKLLSGELTLPDANGAQTEPQDVAHV